MSEERKTIVKWLGTEEIDVDLIDMSNLQARQDQINAGLEAFAEQIRGAGQIQSIVVYRKGDRFELLVGQRRFLAFQKVLNWDKIRADIIEEPKDEQMKTTISSQHKVILWYSEKRKQLKQNPRLSLRKY